MSFKDIGLRIQLAREEKEMSQEQLARAMGCSQSALSNYEKGKRRLYLSQLEKLAGILEKPMDYFMESWSPKENHSSSSENFDTKIVKIVRDLHQLSEEQLEELSKYIHYLKWKGNRG